MQDNDLIYDEINNKIYDPELDLEEYKKARKYRNKYFIYLISF